MRGLYIRSKAQAEYETFKSIIIKTVSDDIVEYDLASYNKEIGSDNSYVEVSLNFLKRKTDGTSLKGLLRVYKSNDKYYIRYTSATGIVTTREAPNDAIFASSISNCITLSPANSTNFKDIVKIKIPISDEKGNKFDINIYARK